MSDLISRAELFNRLATAQDKAEIFAIIQDMPTVEKTGHWIFSECDDGLFYCSECGRWMSEFDIHDEPIFDEFKNVVGIRSQYPNFCHACGADMRGENESR